MISKHAPNRGQRANFACAPQVSREAQGSAGSGRPPFLRGCVGLTGGLDSALTPLQASPRPLLSPSLWEHKFGHHWGRCPQQGRSPSVTAYSAQEGGDSWGGYSLWLWQKPRSFHLKLPSPALRWESRSGNLPAEWNLTGSDQCCRGWSGEANFTGQLIWPLPLDEAKTVPSSYSQKGPNSQWQLNRNPWWTNPAAPEFSSSGSFLSVDPEDSFPYADAFRQFSLWRVLMSVMLGPMRTHPPQGWGGMMTWAAPAQACPEGPEHSTPHLLVQAPELCSKMYFPNLLLGILALLRQLFFHNHVCLLLVISFPSCYVCILAKYILNVISARQYKK